MQGESMNPSTAPVSSRFVISLSRWRLRQLFFFFFFPSLSAKMVPLTHSNVCKACRRAHGPPPRTPAPRWGEADARPSLHSQRGAPTSAVTQVGSGCCRGNRSCREGGRRAQGPRMPQPLQAACVRGIQTPAGHTVGPQGRSHRPMAEVPPAAPPGF